MNCFEVVVVVNVGDGDFGILNLVAENGLNFEQQQQKLVYNLLLLAPLLVPDMIDLKDPSMFQY